MNKKAQAEIIVTILIILLVLAAIVIVWQVISSTINQGAKEIPGQTDCLMTKVDIIEAKDGFCSAPAILTKDLCVAPDTWTSGSVTLKRSVGTGKLVGVYLYVDGSRNATIDFTRVGELRELDQKTFSLSDLDNAGGKKIQVAKLIGNDIESARLCEFSDNSLDDPIKIKTY